MSTRADTRRIGVVTDAGTGPGDGALGLDVFAGRAIAVQLTPGTLTVESPASLAARVAPATGAVAVPMRVVCDTEGLALAVNLGVTFLRGWDVTRDLATGRAWVAPASRA
ncbi:hypothetical protein tb265_11360 [Gemmatimonadetes bacterium T265]|nr:hypothetical protein tb265_11360 [Gemmatimonadetes bacterium T265]